MTDCYKVFHSCTYQFDKELLRETIYLSPRSSLEEIIFLGVHQRKGVFFCPAESNGGETFLASLSEEGEVFTQQGVFRPVDLETKPVTPFAQQEDLDFPSWGSRGVFHTHFLAAQLDSQGRVHLLEQQPVVEYELCDEDDPKNRIVRYAETYHVEYSLFDASHKLAFHLDLGPGEWLLAPSLEGEVYLVDFWASSYEAADSRAELWSVFPAARLAESGDLAWVQKELAVTFPPPVSRLSYSNEVFRVALGGGKIYAWWKSFLFLEETFVFCSYYCPTKATKWTSLACYKDDSREMSPFFLPGPFPSVVLPSGQSLLFQSPGSCLEVDSPLDFSLLDRLAPGGEGRFWGLESDTGRAYRFEIALVASLARAAEVLRRETTHALYRPGGLGYERARDSFLKNSETLYPRSSKNLQ